ncbi:MAG: tetratricopeptide repeat protein, partial [Rhodobacteraceae bacterium]|nr:tetratricopeptide repeat protein [Paracoccaceae bacterium]
HGMTAEVLAGLGSANLGLGRLGTAEKLLREAIEKEEKAPEVWNNLGVVLMEKGDLAEAEQVFKRAYALDNGESDSIRDNLRLVLANSEVSDYAEVQEQDYKLVRRGSSDFVIRSIP